jgi:acetylornithine deacetylase
VNRIKGGTAVNILAATCEFGWDIRTMPGDTPATIIQQFSSFCDARLAELARQGKTCAVDISVLADVPPLQGDAGDAERLALTSTEVEGDSIAVPYGTEAGQFQRAGWSTVVCGPGNIEQAHKPDEYIERSELVACEAFLDRAVAVHCISNASRK